MVAAGVWLIVAYPAARAQSVAIHWYKDLGQASAAAQKNNQPMMIDFWADWCAPCKLMDKEVYADPALLAAFGQKLIGVRIHFDLQPEIARRYNVPALPYLVFTDSYGTELMHQRGLIAAGDLTAVVQALPADISEINRLDRILQQDKEDFTGLLEMGNVLRASGFYSSSNAYYARALKQAGVKKDAPHREQILYSMALNWVALEDGKSAANALERCVQEFPQSSRRAEMLLGLGKAYALDVKKEKARKSWNSVIAEFPQSDAARQARALLQSL